MLKNLVKLSNYLSNLGMNISGIKWIVFQPKIFSIRSLFVLFHLVYLQIVRVCPNIAVASNSHLGQKIFFNFMSAMKQKFTKLIEKFEFKKNLLLSYDMSHNETLLTWRHDTQYKDIQHNDTQHKGIIWDIHHKDTQHSNTLSLYWMSLCWVSFFIVMLNAIMLKCRYTECRYAECCIAHQVA